jgi:thymidylate kinase
MLVQIRGTNGSGKTTLARRLIGESPNPVDLVWYPRPTRRDPDKKASVEGYGGNCWLAVGSYRQGCGGMDTIPSFDLQQQGCARALEIGGELGCRVVSEGVLASTVAGSWLEFFKSLRAPVLVAYLDTPLELCLERIRERQRASGRGERDVKVDQIAAKVRAIEATRARFQSAGITTALIRHDAALDDLMEAIDLL